MKKILLGLICILALPQFALANNVNVRIYASDEISHDIVEIQVGDDITWINEDSDEHEIIGPSFSFTLSSGQSRTEPFNTAGDYNYYIDSSSYSYSIRVAEVNESTAEDRPRRGTTYEGSRAISDEDFPPSSGEPINQFESPTTQPQTCPDGSTANYPQCLFGITGNENLIPNASYLPQIQDNNLSGKELLLLITRFILGFVGAVALLILVIGGFMYLMARGDESQTEKAKNTIIGAIIGIIIILAAWTIVTTVLNITERRGGNQFLPGNSQQNNP